MMIPQEFIEEVQARTDIVELISSYFPLKRAGRNFKALCPFHMEKTPSFFVSPQKQIFHCFGCGEGGGPIQFLMLYEKVSFPEAVEILAKRLGLTIPYKKTSPQERIKSMLYEVTEEACNFFHKNLFREEGEKALEYLKKRDIDLETIKKFRLGFASSKISLLDSLRNKGYSLEILEKASLIVSKKEGGYIDLFRDRIVFPIFDVKGKVIGFGARLIEERDAPKYINSIENPLYNKRFHLYGLNFSKEEIIKKDSVIIVEGYFDMITPYVKGVKNIAASLGTALTLEQIRLIKRYTKNVILIFDSDVAGEMANLRALDLLLENGLKVSVVTFPQGFDPDSLIREKGVDYFLKLLKEKKDFFEYKLEVLRKNFDIESIEGKAKLTEEILLTLNKLESEVEKYEYVKKLASYLGIREEVLMLELKRIGKKEVKSFFKNGKKIMFEPVPLAEKILLYYLFTQGKANILKYLNETDFTHPLAKKVVNLLSKLNIKENREENNILKKFLGMVEDREISCFVSWLLMEEIPLEKTLLKRCLEKLKKRRLKRLREELKEKLRIAEANKNIEEMKKIILKYEKLKEEGNG